MAASVTTMLRLNSKCLSVNNYSRKPNTCKHIKKSISLRSLPIPPRKRNIAIPNITKCFDQQPSIAVSLATTAIAGAVFNSVSPSDAAFAAQQIAESAEGVDKRGLAILLPIIPAILWALYNILGPAINQINSMRSERGVIVGLGLGGLAASSFFIVPDASASEVASIAEVTSDYQSLFLL